MKRFDDSVYKTLKQAYDFFLDDLGLRDCENQIGQVVLVSNTKNWKEHGFSADCNGFCRYIEGSSGKRVEIFVRATGTLFGAVEILAHEMVHAQQFLHNRTVFIGEELIHLGNSYEHLPWNARPCEAEARDLQHRLTLKFVRHMESQYKNWLD